MKFNEKDNEKEVEMLSRCKSMTHELLYGEIKLWCMDLNICRLMVDYCTLTRYEISITANKWLQLIRKLTNFENFYCHFGDEEIYANVCEYAYYLLKSIPSKKLGIFTRMTNHIDIVISIYIRDEGFKIYPSGIGCCKIYPSGIGCYNESFMSFPLMTRTKFLQHLETFETKYTKQLVDVKRQNHLYQIKKDKVITLLNIGILIDTSHPDRPGSARISWVSQFLTDILDRKHSLPQIPTHQMINICFSDADSKGEIHHNNSQYLWICRNIKPIDFIQYLSKHCCEIYDIQKQYSDLKWSEDLSCTDNYFKLDRPYYFRMPHSKRITIDQLKQTIASLKRLKDYTNEITQSIRIHTNRTCIVFHFHSNQSYSLKHQTLIIPFDFQISTLIQKIHLLFPDTIP